MSKCELVPNDQTRGGRQLQTFLAQVVLIIRVAIVQIIPHYPSHPHCPSHHDCPRPDCCLQYLGKCELVADDQIQGGRGNCKPSSPKASRLSESRLREAWFLPLSSK